MILRRAEIYVSGPYEFETPRKQARYIIKRIDRDYRFLHRLLHLYRP